MQLLRSILIVLTVFGCFTACKKDDASNTGSQFTPGSIVSLKSVKTLYRYTDITLDDIRITGTVISDNNSKNLPQGYVVIQDATGGIVLSMTAAQAQNFQSGDSLLINANKATLSNSLGITLVKNIPDNAINKIAGGKTVKPVNVSLGELSAGFKNYEATLVRIQNATITPLISTEIKFAGSKSLDDISGSSTIRLHTLATASFADSLLPSGATLIAIPLFYNEINENTSALATKRLYLRSYNEVSPVITIAAWQFNSPASAGTEASYGATTTAPQTTQAVLLRGSGYNPSALARGFSSNVNATTVTKDDAITNKAYYQFSVSAAAGKSLSFAGLTCRLRRSSAGASAFNWMYSFDGINFKSIGPDLAFTSTADGVDQAPIDLSSITALQNIAPGTTITFRLYGWGFGNVGSGTFAIGRFASGINTNSLTLSGNIQ